VFFILFYQARGQSDLRAMAITKPASTWLATLFSTLAVEQRELSLQGCSLFVTIW